MKNLLFCCVTVVLLSFSWAGTTQPRTTQKNTTPTIPGTTLTPEEVCKKQSGGGCDSCIGVANAQCVYCESTKSCKLKKSIIPTDECKLADAKWGVCWVNYEALIIATSVVGCLIILGIAICCCCCCCRGSNKAKLLKTEAKYQRERDERKVKQTERKAERKERTDEIRRKYGLIKDDTPYSRFQ